MLKYPLEVASIVRKQTFYVESHLGTAKIANNEHPLHTYDKFSRFSFCIINEKRMGASANMPVKEVIHLARKAAQAELTAQIATAPSQSNLSKAYTVRFFSGELKGKTPADVLLENPSEAGIQVLQGQLNWLKANLQKYPKNQELIEAIREAAKLYRSGQLSANHKNTGVIELYKADMRPLVRRQRPDGMSFVYSFSINWVPGNQYPVEIRIVNYYAPVTKLPDGRLNVQVKQRDQSSVIDNTMLLTGNEFMEVLYALQMNMRQFEMIHAKEVFTEAIAESDRQRQSYTEAPAMNPINPQVPYQAINNNPNTYRVYGA